MRSVNAALGLFCVLNGSVLAPSLARATPTAATIAFQGTYRGSSSMPNSDRHMTETIVASGRATLLGDSRLQSTAISGPLNPGGCIPFTGHGRLSAAGRSALTYRYWFSPCFRPLPPNALPMTGRYIITGGSGRLHGASGSGTYVERFRNDSGWQAPPGQVRITLRGTLRLRWTVQRSALRHVSL